MIINGIDLLNIHVSISQVDASFITELLRGATRIQLEGAAERVNQTFGGSYKGADAMAAAMSFEVTVGRALVEAQKVIAQRMKDIKAEQERLDKQTDEIIKEALSEFDGPVN